jgi:DNA-binding response OmpR family regulator
MVNRKLIAAGKYLFDPANFQLQHENKMIELTQREAELLNFFLEHRNEVLKREQILTSIWGQDGYFFGRSLDVFVSRLRKIFVMDGEIRIENLHGIGYRMIVPESSGTSP